MNRVLAIFVLVFVSIAVQADSVSYTGILSSSTDVVQQTFTLSSPATIGLQTWGFGGGKNAAGTVISPGGTDPFLAIFFGTGASATILTDGLANPYGTSLDMTNYGNPDFLGCPPAGNTLFIDAVSLYLNSLEPTIGVQWAQLHTYNSGPSYPEGQGGQDGNPLFILLMKNASGFGSNYVGTITAATVWTVNSPGPKCEILLNDNSSLASFSCTVWGHLAPIPGGGGS